MKRILLTGLFASLLTMPALAVETGDQYFDRIDTDSDEQLSLDEFLKGSHSVSKGGDGTFLLSPVASGEATENAELSEKHKRVLFERLDIDKNGAINRKEWQDSLSTGMVIFRF